MNFFLKKLNIIPPSQQARDTIKGVCLVNLGSGLTIATGSINLYFFSYFNMIEEGFNVKVASAIQGVVMILLCLAGVFSLQIAGKIGIQRHIRIFGIVYLLSLITSAFMKSFPAFAFFYMLLGSSSYALVAIPNINCLWSHFDKASSGKISGLAFFCLSTSTILAIGLFTAFINPDNESPTLSKMQGDQEVKFFGSEITSRFQYSFLAVNMLQTISILSGLFKISKKEESSLQQPSNDSLEPQTLKENKPVQVQYQFKISEDEDQEVDDETNAEENNSTSIKDNTKIEDKLTVQNNYPYFPTLKESLRKEPFIVIYSCGIINSLAILFLSMNFRVYISTKISDDYFITFVMMGSQIVAAIANITFGQLIDRICFKKCLLVSQLIVSFFGATIPFVSSNKPLLLIWYLIISTMSNGLQTIMGPIFVKIFGVETGSKLLPIKSTSFFFSAIMVQFINYLVFSFFNYDSVIFVLGLNMSIGLLLLRRLQTSYTWQRL